METNREREIRLPEYVNKQRQKLPGNIDEEDLYKLSKESGFSIDDIRDANEESEDFWK